MAATKAAPDPVETPPVFYPQVQAILAAAGGSQALWTLDRDGFVEAELYGQKLVAPEQALTCCGQPLANAEPRSERSALIKGLRGQAPFDSSQYPPLPWGGSRVAPADVDIIARWIDEGCPSGSRASLSAPVEGEAAPSVEVKGLAGPVYGVLSGNTNAYRAGAGEPLQRMSLDCMDDAQIAQLRAAFRGLYELNNGSRMRAATTIWR